MREFAHIIGGEVAATYTERDGFTAPDGTQHSRQIWSDAWSDAERAAIGLYPIRDDNEKPDPRWHSEISALYAFHPDLGDVIRTWGGEYEREKHVTAMLAEVRAEEIARIDAEDATGDDRAKITLLAAAVADIIAALAPEHPAIADHLAPWAKVLAIQSKGAEIRAAVEADPNVNREALWG